MTSLLLASIAFCTAVLSGVFGMAGGMLLMGAYAALLPVSTAMVLHGATQFVANGVRAGLLWRSIYARGLAFYAGGALLAFAALAPLRYVPSPIVVHLGLGLAPFAAALLPSKRLDFQRPAAAFACGAQVAGVQLLAGAAGPLLDVAFVDTRLSRTQVVATKAITQVLSHALKLVYFAPFVAWDELPAPMIGAIVTATLLGTVLGTRILARLSEPTFRSASRRIVYAIGAFYLGKAAVALIA